MDKAAHIKEDKVILESFNKDSIDTQVRRWNIFRRLRNHIARFAVGSLT